MSDVRLVMLSMNLRALHLADVLGAQLIDLGPGARALSVEGWIAEDLELDQAGSLRHGRTGGVR
jgi:hypothetical protein